MGKKIENATFLGNKYKMSGNAFSREAVLLIVVTDLNNPKAKPLVFKTFNF